jgi:uncharacterized membrane protein YkgB
MSIFKRPIQNIKQIDYTFVLWMLGWGLILVFFSIPLSTIMELKEILPFIFSFEFLPVEEMNPVVMKDGLPRPYLDVNTIAKNRMYQTFNILKVIHWVFVFLFIIGFLFKKPKHESIKNKG